MREGWGGAGSTDDLNHVRAYYLTPRWEKNAYGGNKGILYTHLVQEGTFSIHYTPILAHKMFNSEGSSVAIEATASAWPGAQCQPERRPPWRHPT
jgi:hypothetical protein